MTQCTAIKTDGERCRGIAKAGSDWCPAHDPSRGEARRRAASKAARSKSGSEIKTLKARLVALADDVLSGRVDKGVAAVVNQIYNTRLRALDLERDIREQDEMLERIVTIEKAMERVAERGKGGGRWEA
jgi:hypothetical protein